MNQKDEKPGRSKWLRLVVLLALLAVVAGYLIATDEGEVGLFARCLTGDGGVWVPAENETFVTDFYGYRFEGETRDIIDMYVYFYGAWEKPMLFLMRDLMREVEPEGGIFVDVGASVGQHSMFMSHHAAEVHAIEPFPPVLVRMRKILATNEAGKKIIVHPVGFAAEEGSLPFHPPAHWNVGTGTFASDGSDPESETLELPLVRGDDELAEVTGIDIIKIDIEGFEKFALQGMSETLNRDRPMVVMELNTHNEEGFHSEEELRAAFPKNYRFFEIRTPRGLRWALPGGDLVCDATTGEYELVPFDMNFGRSQRNVLATPEEFVEKLPHRR